ncbi:MAG TPA: hypothetical protein VK338_05975 [Candidatus Nitrosocosmicus sp.]|nr:hypothetical protein [Candidatus Nitrosocosmicus sp.]
MSIVVTCNLADGVIVGTDSAVTIEGQVSTPVGLQTGILKVYNHSEKLFQLEDLPVAIASYGLGSLGDRSIGSYVKEFEFLIKNKKKLYKSQSAKRLNNLTVQEIALQLHTFFLDKYKETLGPLLEKELGVKYEDIPQDKKPIIGLVVAGISPNEYLSEVWQILVPLEDSLTCIRERGSFGTNWFGQIESLTRMIKGFAGEVPNGIIDYFVRTYKIDVKETDINELKKILAEFEYKIPYQAMPIQEGINHVKYLLDLVIGQTQFVIGAPICGGPIRIGVVRRGETVFRFITENSLKVDNIKSI